jgi:hypothetical protein
MCTLCRLSAKWLGGLRHTIPRQLMNRYRQHSPIMRIVRVAGPMLQGLAGTSAASNAASNTGSSAATAVSSAVASLGQTLGKRVTTVSDVSSSSCDHDPSCDIVRWVACSWLQNGQPSQDGFMPDAAAFMIRQTASILYVPLRLYIYPPACRHTRCAWRCRFRSSCRSCCSSSARRKSSPHRPRCAGAFLP